MNEEDLNYSSHKFGTFTLAEDKIEWVDPYDKDKTGAITYADVCSVLLDTAGAGGPSSMGQASLVNDIGGTTATTISGTSGTDSAGSDERIMMLKSDSVTLNISMTPNLDDDEAFLSFIKALHNKIATANTSVKFSIAGMSLIPFIFISVMLLVMAGGAAFFGNALVSFPMFRIGLTAIGALLAIGAVALLRYGIKKSKPKAYDPLNIPDDVFSS